MKQQSQTISFLLRFVVALEVLIYFVAVLLHLGIRIPLGVVVLAVPNIIIPAAIVETILGLLIVTNLTILLAKKPRVTKTTFIIHLIVLFSVLFGMTALALRVGPPPSPDWTLHYVMLAAIAVVMVLLYKAMRSKQG